MPDNLSQPEAQTTSPPEIKEEITSLGLPSPLRKPKKIKIALGILGLFFILTSIPAAVFLVKQRQEIRKEAAMGGPVEFRGIRISAIKEDPPTAANGGTYSTTFKIKNTTSTTKTVVLEKHQCACPEGQGNPPGKCFNWGQPGCPAPQTETVSLSRGQSIERTVSAQQPGGQVCGSFQVDIIIKSVY
jgi:hypothetical protein